MLFVFIFFLQKHGIVVSHLLFSKYIKYTFLTVARRLAYSRVEPRIGKAVDYTIVSVGIGQISEEGLDDARSDYQCSGKEGEAYY